VATARVLIVDDDPSILMLASTALKAQHKYEILSASHPLKALEFVKKEPWIDLVLSEIEMPDMQGPKLLSQISKLSPATIGALMSGDDQKLAKLPVGMPFLRKPFTSEELSDMVARVLARTEQIRSDLKKKMKRAVLLVDKAHSLKHELNEAIRESSTARKSSRVIRKVTTG
jgi:DNA-binding NtrC family response regulator